METEFGKLLREKIALLLPYRIGAKGQLQEWQHDFAEVDPKHSHHAHLYGLHPGNQITPDHTPELMQAVARTLERRGDEATGWSMGWKINFWARMLDGDHANRIIRNLFRPVGFGEKKNNGGGLYPNLLDACPPFQIDGNFGFVAGVSEMLLQSHAGYVHLLPALPSAWPSGRITGLRTRGGFIVDMEWKDGQLAKAYITSTLGGNCRLRTSQPVTVKNVATSEANGQNPNPLFGFIDPGKPQNQSGAELTKLPVRNSSTVDFVTEKGTRYEIAVAQGK